MTSEAKADVDVAIDNDAIQLPNGVTFQTPAKILLQGISGIGM